MGARSTIVMLVLSIVLWGTNFNLAKPVLAELHPLVAASGRFVVAALVMLALMAARRERLPRLRHWGAYAVLGVVGIAGFNLLFFQGMQSTSAVNGALVMASNPLVTTLLAALFLGERPNRRQMLALPVALAGVAVVLLGGNGGGLSLNPGDTAMLAANLCWAAYNILVRKLMPPASGIANTTGVMVVGAAVLTLAAWAADAPVAVPGPAAAGAMAAMAVFGTVVAYLFYNTALVRLGAARTALFLNLVPVVAMAVSAATGQPPSLPQLAGAAVTIGAVTLATLPVRRRGLKLDACSQCG